MSALVACCCDHRGGRGWGTERWRIALRLSALRFIPIVAVLAVPATAARASASAPTLDAIASAAKTAQATHCTTDGCVADITIDRAMNILLDSQSTDQGLTSPATKDRDVVAARRLRSVLLGHRHMFVAVCHRLRGLAAQYPPGDLFVAVGVIHLALLMDRPSGGCLPAVLAAFPPSAPGRMAIGNARILCLNEWRLGARYCARIEQKS